MDSSHDRSASGCPGCPMRQWQEDFPITWQDDHYVTRRELSKFMTLGSALLAVANSLMASIGLSARKGGWPRLTIANASTLPRGGSMLFRYPTEKDPCILLRQPDGELQAYSQVCTHLACAVVHRPEEDVLFCPCHHGYFSVAEGRPLAGPPTRRLPRILLELRGEEIQAVGVEV